MPQARRSRRHARTSREAACLERRPLSSKPGSAAAENEKARPVESRHPLRGCDSLVRCVVNRGAVFDVARWTGHTSCVWLPAMVTSLRAALDELAEGFAQSVLQAIREASLHELVSGNGQPRAPVRAVRQPAVAPVAPAANKTSRTGGRLRRRSAEDIAAALGQVISLVKRNKAGLRAEQIRIELGLQAKEMPRILKEGLAKKALRTKGQKRATTYFAA
jgi:hypothetical protein